MEVLHDLRPERRIASLPTSRRAVFAHAAALALLLGCTREATRDLQTADTAAAMSAGGIRDSTAGASSAARPDTATNTARDDSVRSNGAPIGPGPMTLVVTVADSAAGDTLYRRANTCQPCHGTRGEGVIGLAPALDDTLWLHGDGSPSCIQHVILDGIAEPKQSSRGMPAFSARLSAGDASRIAAYVYTLSRTKVTVTQPFGSTPAHDTASPQ